MNQKNKTKKWMIKFSSGKIKGPHSTEMVHKMILEGLITGEDLISEENTPDLFIPLDRVAEFYDSLLTSLENDNVTDDDKFAKMEAETVIKPKESSIEPKDPLEIENKDASSSEQILEKLNESFKHLAITEAKNSKNEMNKKTISLPASSIIHKAENQNALIQARDENFTIELNKFNKNIIDSKIKIAIIGLCSLIVFIGWYIYSLSNKNVTLIKENFELLPLSKKTVGLKIEKTESLKLKELSILLLKSGEIENTFKAQKNLIQLLSWQPENLELLGLLCVSYEQLWPYTKQSVEGQKAITLATQQARTIDPLSKYSETCQIVNLISKGLYQESRGLIEKTLDQDSDERYNLKAFLFYIKGQQLEESQDFLTAEAYFDEAIKSFPGWLWAMFAKARVQYKQNKFNEARSLYSQILGLNKNYKAALYGIALIDVKSNQIEQADSKFNDAFSLNGFLPKSFHLESLLAYAKLLLEKGQNKKVKQVVEMGLSISPSHNEFKNIFSQLGGDLKSLNPASELALTGEQFARSGDHLAAQAQFKAAFDLDSQSQYAIKAAKSLWALNQPKDALNWLDKAIAKDKKNVLALTLKADYLSQKYDFANATTSLQLAQKNNPNNFDVLKTMAIIEFRKHNLSQVMIIGQRALKIYDADVELLCLLANASIDIFLNSATLIDDKEKIKTLEQAQKFSSKAVDLEPGLPETQITYSKYLYASSGTLSAENNFKKLIETFPYSLDYKLGFGEFYEYLEKYKSALNIYQTVYSLDPKNKKAHLGLARSYRALNDIKNAQKYFLSAAVLDPSDVEPLFLTAKLDLETLDKKNAQTQLKSALDKFKLVQKINPNFPRIYYHLAKCYLELGDFDKAIENAAIEKTNNPSIADPYILSAQIYSAKNQFKDCTNEYTKAITLRPNQTELYISSSICHRKNNAIETAQDMIEIAKTKENGFPPIYREQGYIFEYLNKKKEAITAFRFYLELSPNAVDRSDIESKINQLMVGK